MQVEPRTIGSSRYPFEIIMPRNHRPGLAQIIRRAQCYMKVETPKLGARYPRVENPLAQGAQHYDLLSHLYEPETPPILNPARVPASSFRINIEEIHATIMDERHP